MSDVLDARAELIAASLATIPSITPEKWAGEEKAFNSDATRPKIYFWYRGAIARETEEIGSVTYLKTLIFWVLVVTEDSQASDGDDEALLYLETLMTALNEASIIGGVCRPYRDPELNGKTEGFITAHGGGYLYAQAWQVKRWVEQ